LKHGSLPTFQQMLKNLAALFFQCKHFRKLSMVSSLQIFLAVPRRGNPAIKSRR
jgi:hypothetical protein